MDNKKILAYINLKLEKLKKEQDHLLDKMLDLKSYEDDEMYRNDYLRSIYAYEQISDIKAFIEMENKK